LSENVIGMIGILDKAAGKMNQEDQDKISRRIGKSIATMDFEIVSQMLAQNIENFFGGTLMQNVVNEIDDAKFAEINEKILTRVLAGKREIKTLRFLPIWKKWQKKGSSFISKKRLRLF